MRNDFECLSEDDQCDAIEACFKTSLDELVNTSKVLTDETRIKANVGRYTYLSRLIIKLNDEEVMTREEITKLVEDLGH